jgi:hypothetical protein
MLVSLFRPPPPPQIVETGALTQTALPPSSLISIPSTLHSSSSDSPRKKAELHLSLLDAIKRRRQFFQGSSKSKNSKSADDNSKETVVVPPSNSSNSNNLIEPISRITPSPIVKTSFDRDYDSDNSVFYVVNDDDSDNSDWGEYFFLYGYAGYYFPFYQTCKCFFFKMQ